MWKNSVLLVAELVIPVGAIRRPILLKEEYQKADFE